MICLCTERFLDLSTNDLMVSILGFRTFPIVDYSLSPTGICLWLYLNKYLAMHSGIIDTVNSVFITTSVFKAAPPTFGHVPNFHLYHLLQAKTLYIATS